MEKQLNGDKFEQSPGDSKGQGSLACSWYYKVGHNLVIEQQVEKQVNSGCSGDISAWGKIVYEKSLPISLTYFCF